MSSETPTSISEWQATVHALARAKGWWAPYTEGEVIRVLKPDEVLSKLMLMVSELAEAAEESCRSSFGSTKIYFVLDREQVDYEKWPGRLKERPKPEGFGVELADFFIRLMDTCGAMGVDLESCMRDFSAWSASFPLTGFPSSIGEWQRQQVPALVLKEPTPLNLVFARLMSVVIFMAKAVEEVRESEKSRCFGVALAEATLAVMELCQILDFDLESCVREKHEYNRTRPWRHGKRV